MTDANVCKDFLQYCFFDDCLSPCHNCQPATSVGPIPDQPVNLSCSGYSNFMDYEIEMDFRPNTINSFPNNNCFWESGTFYGILKADYSNFQYYNFSNGTAWTNTVTLTRLNKTIRNNRTNELGNKLTLCNEKIRFNGFGENAENFSLGFGGVYTLEIPKMQPLYFAFPYPRFLWYFNGPDMRIVPRYEITSNTCNTSSCGFEQKEINEEYRTCINTFMNDNVFGFNDNTYLVSTDKNTIYNFWKTPAITVALGGGNMSQTCAYRQFYSASNPSPGP
jgi:hypothetical protein